MVSVQLSLYNTTYQFGRLDCDIQGRKVDIEDRQRQGGVAAGSELVGYWELARIPYHTEGGGVLC